MRLEQKILQSIKNRKSDWHKPRISIYHASQIYDICYGMKPAKFFTVPKFSDEALFTMEIGTMYHNHISSFFSKDEQDVKIEIIQPDFKIIGRTDLFVNGVPIELKTCSEFPRKPYKSHEFQLQCYLQALKADYGFLTYIEKDKRIIKTKNFKIKRDDELFAKILKKVGEFNQKLKCLEKK